MKMKPKNYQCLKCENKQYTNAKCYKCRGTVFRDLKGVAYNTVTLTDEELDMISAWGFIVSTERPLNKKEQDLYFKLTNG